MKKYTTDNPPNPSGLCMCGCGQTTKIAKSSNRKYGWVMGEHYRYIVGHTPRTTVPLEERFWARVSKGTPDECWEWTGGKITGRYAPNGKQYGGGYGLLSVNASTHILAHRFSYELHNGPIPEGLEIRHICNRPSCCNPHHLLIGTHADNMQDMANSKRSRLILTYEQIRELRELDPHGIQARTEAGKRLGVSYAVVKTILAPRNKDKWRE